MNCLQNLSRFSVPHLLVPKVHPKKHPTVHLGEIFRADRRKGSIVMNAHPSSSDTEKTSDEVVDKSDIYSNDMTKAMGAALTYRHELGMNYDFILPDLIVGSCLQTPSDVDTLRRIGVKTIFCLQQDSDLEYFGVDIDAIREYAMQCGDIHHLRAEIRFEGVYEYKYIIDGEWICNPNELLTNPNRDGHVNNYVQVFSENERDHSRQLRERLASENINLTAEERWTITEFLETFNDK